MFRILMFTPTWEKRDGSLAMRPEMRASVERQVYDRKRIAVDWEISTHNPFAYETHKNVLAQYRRGRQMALDGGYDALLTVEHDMVLPAEAVARLADGLRFPAGVVYGVYLLRHGSLVLNAWEYIGDRNLGESLSLMPEKLAAARAAGVARVCGCGWGCTLITRPVLERIEFHDANGENDAGDLAFAADCLRANIVSVARFDVACDHIDGEVILRPYDGGIVDRVTVVANETINIAVVTKTMHLEGGEEYLLPRDVASELQRAGYVRITDNDFSAAEAGNSAQEAREGDEAADMSREPETAALEPKETATPAKPKRKIAKGRTGNL